MGRTTARWSAKQSLPQATARFSRRTARPRLEVLEERLQPGETFFLGLIGLGMADLIPDPFDPRVRTDRSASEPASYRRPLFALEEVGSPGMISLLDGSGDERGRRADTGGSAASAPVHETSGTLETAQVDDYWLAWQLSVPRQHAPMASRSEVRPTGLPETPAVVGAPASGQGTPVSGLNLQGVSKPEEPSSAFLAATHPAAPPLDLDSVAFDSRTGTLAIRGDGKDNVIREACTADGHLEVTLDGHGHSSDPASASFDPLLAGATSANLTGIRLDGAGGQDTLVLGSQRLPGDFFVSAAGAKVVAEDVTDGGQLVVQASDITVGGMLRGGAVALAASGWVTIEAEGAVVAAAGDAGGRIEVVGDKFVNSGQLHADGRTGGRIAVEAGNVLNAGPVTADGTGGAGGTVRIAFAESYIDTVAAMTSANGGTSGHGGHVVIEGGTTGQLFSSGRHQATGIVGGAVDLLGREVVLAGATVDVSGESGGGTLRIGGDFQGKNFAVSNAQTVTVTSAATIKADALGSGSGGRVIVWADQTTEFEGAISARGGSAGGSGGFIEVSGKGSLSYGGSADAGARLGKTGTLLLDPKNIVISAAPAGLFPQFDLMDPHPTAGGHFGTSVNVLSTGNVVVTNPNDNFGGRNAGAVYLFDGLTGVLISSLLGGNANEMVGGNGVTLLRNSNYLVQSPLWNGQRGAVTWANGTTGISGTVSDANSLVGSHPNDLAGNSSIVLLSNGNYVVPSPGWNGNRGAATWGNSAMGIAGPISEVNSLVGTNIDDGVGLNVTFLSNGNYAVKNPHWNGARGAVTWGNGATGVSGTVSSANSLVGTNPNDRVGNHVTSLTNGNYVIQSDYWNGNRGAVTWEDGTRGVSGMVSEANSLIGNNPDENVGNLTLLSNGNYLVLSSYWNDQRGAVTWGSGTVGVRGTISEANSLVGTNPHDQVGHYPGITPLSNGNYVVGSVGWNGSRGAATWGNGTMGVVGPVSAGNSLVGTHTAEGVGREVIPLSNGNYVVRSPGWNVTNGAVTWGNGNTGISGTISSNNSLVGNGDYVGSSGVTALTNGNFVVSSSEWNNQRGAVTWGNGTMGITGFVSPSNSLVGTQSSDGVGALVTPLPNGNYVVQSRNWNGSRGAVTWEAGTSGVSDIVSSANSLVGTNFDDEVGNSGVSVLSNGNYVVQSWKWNNWRGAATWGNGTIGVVGPISTANSLVGANYDRLGQALTTLSNGNYVVQDYHWGDDYGALTWGNGTSGVSGIVSEANSFVGNNDGDRVGLSNFIFLSNGNYLVPSPSWNFNRGAVSWFSGTTGQSLDGSHVLTPQNSLVGRASNAGLRTIVLDPIHQSILAPFEREGTGRVTVGLTDPNQFTYARAQAQTVTLTPDFLAATLNTGTTVVLQASNDITVEDPITVDAGGNGGALTLQAGRGILLNASIATDNGPLILIANDTLANGVVDAQRDPGNAFITMAGRTTLDTGTGPVTIELRDGRGRTNTSSRSINLQTLTAGSVAVVNNGLSIGSDVLLGPVTSSGSQHYSSPRGTTIVTDNLIAADNPITFTDSVVVHDRVRVDAGADTVHFSGSDVQTLQTGPETQFGNVAHDGGTLQLAGRLAVTGTFVQSTAIFDANDQPVSVSGQATIAGGTYLAGTASQDFQGGLILADGVFTTSTGPMNVSGPIAVAGGQLSGDGTVGPLTAIAGTVAPGSSSPGILFVTGAVSFFAATNFSVRLDGLTPGSDYSQLKADGPIFLGNSTLTLVLDFQPPVGGTFEIVTTADPGGISGTFAGLPEGAVFSQDGYQFQIAYQGGDLGNSVVLTRLP